MIGTKTWNVFTPDRQLGIIAAPTRMAAVVDAIGRWPDHRDQLDVAEGDQAPQAAQPMKRLNLRARTE